MTQICPDAIRLRHDLEQCSAEKEAQIDSLSHQINGIRSDMMRLDGDLNALTVSVTKMGGSIDVIAANTTEFMELMRAYKNIKGFGWVVKNSVFLLIGTSAFITAVVYLVGVKFHIGV